MALDVGSKRIGIAVSDPSATFALPIATIDRTNRREDLARLKELVDSYGVDELVVGDPLRSPGIEGSRRARWIRSSRSFARFSRVRFIEWTSVSRLPRRRKASSPPTSRGKSAGRSWTGWPPR